MIKQRLCDKIIDIMTSVMILLTIIGLLTIFHPCYNNTMSKCNHNIRLCIIVASLLLFIKMCSFIIDFIIHKIFIYNFLTLIHVVINIGILTILNNMGNCQNELMDCNTMAIPFANIMLISICLLDAISILANNLDD